MRHRDLWMLATDILESYYSRVKLTSNVCILPPEEHIEEHLNDSGPLNPNEASFVRQCVLGVIRHHAALDGALCGFCDALKRNKQDRLSMYLIAYLLVFRFDELGGRFIRSLIDQSTSSIRLAEYVGFLLDKEQLLKFGVPHWTEHYDDAYATDFIIGSLMKNKTAATRDVLNYFLEKATNAPIDLEEEEADVPALSGSPVKSRGKKSPEKRKSTIPCAPRLSVGGTRLRDLELAMIPPFEVREMVHTIAPEKPPRVVSVADGVIPLNGTRPFREPTDYRMNPHVGVERPSNLPRLLKELEDREEKVRQPDPAMLKRIQPGEVRQKLAPPDTVVRTTAATVRREQLLYKRRDDEKAAILHKKEIEMRDDGEFQAWKKKEDEREKVERDAHIAERKLLMMISDEEAKASKARQEHANQVVSKQFRSVMHETRAKVEAEKHVEQKHKKQSAKELRLELAQQAEVAVAGVATAKKTAAVELKAEKQLNEQRVAIQLELERERKVSMIQEIKKIHAESVSMRAEQIERRRVEMSTVDLGQLVTMTVEELIQKLVEVRKEQKDLEEERREAITKHRTMQRQELSEMQAQCEAERRAFLEDKERQRSEKRLADAAHVERLRLVEETRLIDLQDKLQNKREQRHEVERLRREAERERKLSGQLLAGDASAVEFNNWKEIERGQQNKLLAVQNAALVQRKQERRLHHGQEDLRETNISTTHRTRVERSVASDSQFESKRTVAVADVELDRTVLKTALDHMREEKQLMRTRTA